MVATLAVAWFPRRTEAVAWLSCRPDLTSVAFSLASLVLFDLALRRLDGPLRTSSPGPPALPAFYVVLSLLSWWLALLSKESALFVPVAHGVLAWDTLTEGSVRFAGTRTASSATRWRRLAWMLAPFALSVPPFLILRRLAIGAWVGGYGPQVLTLTPGTLISAAKHLAYQIVPPLEPLESLVGAAWPRPIVAAMLLLLIGVAVRAAWAARRDVALRVGVAWTLANVLPVITLPVSLATTYNDRLLYLPAFGVAFMAAAVLRRLSAPLVVALAAFGIPLLGAWSWTLSERWAQANVLSTTTLNSLADRVRHDDAARIYIASVPDSVGGAYVLRNGINHALSTMGVPDPMRVVPLSFYFADPRDLFDTPVTATLDGPLTVRLTAAGTPRILLPLAGAEQIARYDTGSAPDRFGQFGSMEVRLRESGRVLVDRGGNFRLLAENP
jgi:hypothetical protein